MEFLYPSLVVLIGTIVYLVFSAKTAFHPMTVVVAGFAIEILLVIFPFMGPVKHFSTASGFFCFLMAVCLAISASKIKHEVVVDVEKINLQFRVPPTLIALSLTGVVLLCSAITYRRNGGFAIFALAGETGLDVSDRNYSKVFTPFITPLGWGCARTITLITALLIVTRAEPILEWISKWWYLLICNALAIGLTLLDGMRGTAVVSCILIIFAVRYHSRIPKWLIVSATAMLFAIFVIAGNARIGDDQGGILKDVRAKPGISHFAATSAIWLDTYLEPNILNLNALINNEPEINYGLEIASMILPHGISKYLFEDPDSSIEYMQTRGLLPYPGFTFRTIFADLYIDFGYSGSLLVGLAIFLVFALSYNRGAHNAQWLVIYLYFIPGICFTPFMNFCLNLTSLLPLLIGYLAVAQSAKEPEVETFSPTSAAEPAGTRAELARQAPRRVVQLARRRSTR